MGVAGERFGEDALRMMRAIRFSAQLGYSIEENTLRAISAMASNLHRISAERIQVELTKLLISPHPDYLGIAYDVGVTKVILPEFDRAMETKQNHPHHRFGVGEHILYSLTQAPAQKVLRLAMLFHDIGKPETLSIDSEGITHFYGHAAVSEGMTKIVLRRLRYDNDTVFAVSRLVYYHDYGNSVEPDMRIVRRAVNKIGEDIFPLLLDVKRADIMAQSAYQREEKLYRLERWEQLYRQILEENQCVSLKTLAVTGSDLIDIGMKPGRGIGEMLKELLELVLESPKSNTRGILLAEAARRLNEFNNMI